MYIRGEEVGRQFGSLQAPIQRKQYTNVQRKRYINVHVGSLEVGQQQPCFGALQAPLYQHIPA